MKDEKQIFFIDNIQKLQWACRRGMLELDVILGNFLKEAYLSLSVQDKKRFINLLESPDPELFTWLMGHGKPQDSDLISIVEIIRNHAKSRI